MSMASIQSYLFILSDVAEMPLSQKVKSSLVEQEAGEKDVPLTRQV